MTVRVPSGRVFCIFLVILSSLSEVANCEIRAFNLVLPPASEFIHFVEGFILTPGYIDLSELQFVAIDNPDSENDGGTRQRALETDSSEGTDFYMDGSALDIAVFHLPEECDSTRTGCDWTELGIGAKTGDDLLRYCCSDDAVKLGLCAGHQKGRLIMDVEKYVGKHRLMNVPASGQFQSSLKFGKFEEKDTSGKYAVVFANCNAQGRPVIVEGRTRWKSKHGYLPGDLFGLMYFYGLLFLVYLGLLTWYGVAMKMFEDANIPIQTWIFGTICMGTVEIFFRFGDLFVWNEDGSRFWVAYYVGVIIGVLKRGISRCLLVMVALGWGVVRDDLGSVMKKIRLLGGIYIAVSLVNDIMTEVAVAEIQRMSQEKEDEIIDIVFILGLVIVFIDLIFYFWIIDSLSGTMEYLESMKQTRKLLRYLRLRCILMFSILFGVIWAVFGIVDTYDQGIVTQEAKWVINSSMEMNYLFILVAVAVLWRPQENAKEYAYVMELPTMSAALDDDDGSDGMIELSDNVPSAADDSDDEFNDEIQA